MSVVINDKPRQRTLKLRWPFSRHLTLSLTTLTVLLAIWWAVAAAQWIGREPAPLAWEVRRMCGWLGG